MIRRRMLGVRLRQHTDRAGGNEAISELRFDELRLPSRSWRRALQGEVLLWCERFRLVAHSAGITEVAILAVARRPHFHRHWRFGEFDEHLPGLPACRHLHARQRFAIALARHHRHQGADQRLSHATMVGIGQHPQAGHTWQALLIIGDRIRHEEVVTTG